MALPISRKPDGALTRRRLAAGALLAVAGAVVAVVLLSAGAPHRSAAAGTGVPAGQTTAVVERRTLTESATVEGTLTYAGKLEVYDRLAGTFTWLPAVGTVVQRGGKLYKIDNHPVVLMYGSVPAYRTLKEGVSDGPDVAELNRNLIDLGYDPYGEITEIRAFTAATAAAVRRWQKAKGLAETGEVELGRVVFAPGARRITSVHVSLGQDPPGVAEPEEANSGAPGSEAPSGEEPAKAPSSEEEPASQAPAAKEPAGKSPGAEHGSSKSHQKAERPGAAKHAAKGPAGKAPASKEAPRSGESSPKEPSGQAPASSKSPGGSEAGGSGGAGGELTLSTTSTRQLVQLTVKADQQRLARLGERVPVILPGGRSVKGRITSVGTVASEGGGSSEGGRSGGEGEGGGGGENATISVTVALAHPVAHLDEAPVSVELLQEERRHVLAVPATALSATAGGGYEVQTLQGDRRVTVPVTPGMFADGYVQVEGAGLREGMTIVESE